MDESETYTSPLMQELWGLIREVSYSRGLLYVVRLKAEDPMALSADTGYVSSVLGVPEVLYFPPMYV